MPNWLYLKSYRVEIKFPPKISKSTYAIAERFSECFISDRSPIYQKLSGITGTLYGTTHYLV